MLLTGCVGAASTGPAASPASNPSPAPPSGEAAASLAVAAGSSAPSPAAMSSAVVVGPSASVPPVARTPRPTATPEPSPVIPATGVTIVQEETSQFELWSPKGQRILVDVEMPDHLTSPPIAADVLLTTHWHGDHYSQDFIDSFPGKALTVEEGALTAGDVKIRSIAAGHNEGDPLLPKDGTDYIFIVDVGGIRVAVFGDLGQEALTPAQMKALGKVDIAISQLENSYSDETVENRKAIAQMTQVDPAILIPTHFDGLPAAKMAMAEWPAMTAGRWVTVSRDRLPKATSVLFMGELAPTYRKLLGITTPSW
jgi:hypothetical protein